MTAAVTLSNKDFPLLWTMWIQYETRFFGLAKGMPLQWTWWASVDVVAMGISGWSWWASVGGGGYLWTWLASVDVVEMGWVLEEMQLTHLTGTRHKGLAKLAKWGRAAKVTKYAFFFLKKVLHTWSFCFWLLFRIWMHLRTEAPTKEWPRNSWQDKEIFSMDFSLSQIVWLFQGVASCQSSPPEFFEKKYVGYGNGKVLYKPRKRQEIHIVLLFTVGWRKWQKYNWECAQSSLTELPQKGHQNNAYSFFQNWLIFEHQLWTASLFNNLCWPRI